MLEYERDRGIISDRAAACIMSRQKYFYHCIFSSSDKADFPCPTGIFFPVF